MAPFGIVTEAWVHKKSGAKTHIGFARFAHTVSVHIAVAACSAVGKFNVKCSELGLQQGNNHLKRSYGSAFGSSNSNIAARIGDWNCPGCNDLQFAKNDKCRKCGLPKPKHIPEAPDSEDKGPKGPIVHPAKPGDWICKNCNDLQFGRNMSCRKCGGPKTTPLNEHNLDVAEKCAAGYASRAGDWICPVCHEIQFAKNSSCKKCGMNKPPPEQIQTIANGAYNAKA